MRNFQNFFDGYLEYSEGHESTPRVRLWSAVSVVAAALERKVWLNRGYYKLFPNLYTFIIGKSGLIKKSTSTGIAVNLLREVQGIRIMAERMTAASVIEQLVASGKTIEVCGKKQGQSAVFAYASELAVFLTEVFGSVTELLTTFYDCVPHDATKPWIYETIGRGEKKIFGPCLNILGASTKTWLRRCIPTSEMEGGFTSRIVFVVENKLPDKLVAWPKLSEDDEMKRLRLIDDLRQIHQLSGEVRVTTDATAMFERWYSNHCRNIIPACKDPRMIGYLSRKGDTILKLGIIHSVATREDLLITSDDLIWGEKHLDALEPDWKNAFDTLGTTSRIANEIMDFIRDKGYVGKRDLISHFTNSYPVNEVLKGIVELKTNQEIEDWSLKNKGKQFYAMPGFEEIISL